LRFWPDFALPSIWQGLPAASIPCGFAPNGLPIGLQIVSKSFEEEMVLGVGHAFESDTDYHLRRRRFQVRNMSAPPTIATKLLRHRLRNAAMPRGFERSSHISLERRDWLAGNVGLELRNVVAKYPFQRSHRFPVIQPNSGRRDYARSSCDAGRRSSGPVPGSAQDACA
jgi:Amidase